MFTSETADTADAAQRKKHTVKGRLVALALAVALCLPGALFLGRGQPGGTAPSQWPPAEAVEIRPAMGGGPADTMPAAFTGVSARAAVLMEADSGALAFRQNENARLPMASTTKIMTALAALSALPPDTPVKIPAGAVGIEGSSIYLAEGEVLTLEQLLYALLLQSANDAAVAIALAVSGSVEDFADLMNQTAAGLGLTDTHFTNPHGLDDPDHYTTARELSLIARAAMEEPLFRKIVATRRYAMPLKGVENGRILVNHNRLLTSYDGAVGVKTGFTKRTGRCLVSAAERDGVRLIAVTLADPDDWRDHAALLDYGFALYQSVSLCEPGFFDRPLPVEGGDAPYVMVRNGQSLHAVLRRDHGPILCVAEMPRFVYAPIPARAQVGRLCFFEERSDGSRRFLGEVPLLTANGADRLVYPQTLWDRLKARIGRGRPAIKT